MRQNVKRKALFLFAKQQKTDFSFFQETHSVIDDASLWKAQWGNDIWFSNGTERAAGAATLKNCFDGNILHSKVDPNGHYFILIVDINDTIILLVNIYGYNSKQENDILFDDLEIQILHWLSKYPNVLILIGGDFNIALDSLLDRCPPRTNNSMAFNLTHFMLKFNLKDIWREKNPGMSSFTWSNKACTSLSRIDFWLISNFLDNNDIKVNILRTTIFRREWVHIGN